MATVCTVISLAACVAFIGIVVSAAIIDLRTLRIPNGLMIAACVVWLAEHAALLALSGAFAAAATVFGGAGFSAKSLLGVLGGIAAFSSGFGSHAPTIGSALAGALLLGGGTLLLSVVYEAVAHKPSIGGGDIKLLFVAGLYLGWWRGLFCVIIACMAFLVLSAVLPRIGWRPEDGWVREENPYGFPFAPAIALGALVALVLP